MLWKYDGGLLDVTQDALDGLAKATGEWDQDHVLHKRCCAAPKRAKFSDRKGQTGAGDRSNGRLLWSLRRLNGVEWLAQMA
jgi:hypothetical protein